MAYRDSTQAEGVGAAASAAVPTGLAADDIIILRQTVAGGNNKTITWPSWTGSPSWTEIGNTSSSSATSADDRTHRVVWARMNSSTPTSFDTSWTGADAYLLEVFVFSGRHTTNPPVAAEVDPTTADTGRPISISATGHTMVAGDDVLYLVDVFGGGDAGTFTTPSGFTQRELSTRLYAIGEAATQENVSAGSMTPITGSWTGPGGYGVSYGTVVVRIPAAAAAAGNPYYYFAQQ